MWIALRSRFAFKLVAESLRSTEIKLLKSAITKKDFGQSYLIVTGESGVGKTCLIRTATNKTPGVITVAAQPADTHDTIIKNVLSELANPAYTFMDPFNSAKRVLFWYRLLTLGRSPIVVIKVTERNVRQDYARLTPAV